MTSKTSNWTFSNKTSGCFFYVFLFVLKQSLGLFFPSVVWSKGALWRIEWAAGRAGQMKHPKVGTHLWVMNQNDANSLETTWNNYTNDAWRKIHETKTTKTTFFLYVFFSFNFWLVTLGELHIKIWWLSLWPTVRQLILVAGTMRRSLMMYFFICRETGWILWLSHQRDGLWYHATEWRYWCWKDMRICSI